ncbi:MAG: DUF4397 domain-containing protein [Gemmatimonadaceae bacterium]|nr:DUF4397 domain-containing protein [Gemmatimonadaceae bacterium]
MSPASRTLALLTAAFLSTACGETKSDQAVETQTDDGTLVSAMTPETANAQGSAMVRVVNAVPMSRDLMIRADENHVLPSVKFGKVSDYQSIDQTWASFQVGDTLAGTYTPLTTNREMLTNGERYSLIVLKNEKGDNFETLVVRDQYVQDPTKAAIRVVHAAPGVKEVIVQPRGGERIVEGLDYGEDDAYTMVAPWEGVLEIRADERNTPVLVTPKVSFEAGKAYTLVVSRDAKGKASLFWFADSPQN